MPIKRHKQHNARMIYMHLFGQTEGSTSPISTHEDQSGTSPGEEVRSSPNSYVRAIFQQIFGSDDDSDEDYSPDSPEPSTCTRVIYGKVYAH